MSCRAESRRSRLRQKTAEDFVSVVDLQEDWSKTILLFETEGREDGDEEAKYSHCYEYASCMRDTHGLSCL
jgi:hypothetical protein